MTRSPLPIDELLPEIRRGLDEHGALVLRAATGAGKTTRVPPALMRKKGRVIVVEPRRIAARVAAARMAAEDGSKVGERIGYHVRFERKVRPSAEIVVVTEGIFLRYLQDDPFLDGVDTVVFDEFHERNVASDLALAMVERVRRDARPELRVIVMSATLAPAPLARYLGDAPTVESEGRSYPLTIDYLPRIDDRPIDEQVVDAVERVVDDADGDVLVFFPGVGEIHRAHRRLASRLDSRGWALCDLYGDLSPDAQDAALRRGERPRVVLATNVAETSVTVEGVTTVIDTGQVRVPRLDAQSGFDRLETIPISQASADQRAGRAGRTAPGRALRLWTSRQHGERSVTDEPELHRVDFAPALLQLLAWGERDAHDFPWYEPPTADTVAQAWRQLELLGAHDDGQITELGRDLARLPLPPRVGRVAIEAHRAGDTEAGARIAVLLAETRPSQRRRDGAVRTSPSDVLDLADAFAAGRLSIPAPEEKRLRRSLRQIEDELTRLTSIPSGRSTDEELHDEHLLRAILAGYPDRVVRRRDPDSDRGVLVGGRGVRLDPHSSVREGTLFVAIDLTPHSDGELRVRMASAIEEEWLESRITRTVDLAFHPKRRRVEAVHVHRYLDLTLRSSPAEIDDPVAAADCLAEAASADLERALPLTNADVARFLGRVRALAEWCPELELPRFDTDELIELLPTLCAGRRSFSELRALPLASILSGLLTPPQRNALEAEAPERFTIPTGRSVPLTYPPGRPPVVAARIQELFGLLETPTIARGRVRLTFELLAPNGRPQQVTDDLASFWSNTYQQVRKDLRARYPKHAWPEDPTTATAESRPRRKK